MQEYSPQFAREYLPEIWREPGLTETTEAVNKITTGWIWNKNKLENTQCDTGKHGKLGIGNFFVSL